MPSPDSPAPDPTPAVLRALDALGVPYEQIPCDPALADTAAFCEHYGYPLENAANAIVVSTKKDPVRHAACLVLATTRLDVNKRVKQLLGGRASFTNPDAMRLLTGMEVGGVTPFALPPELPIYVDSRIAGLPWVIVGTGGRTSKIQVAPEVFERMPSATFIEGLARPRPA